MVRTECSLRVADLLRTILAENGILAQYESAVISALADLEVAEGHCGLKATLEVAEQCAKDLEGLLDGLDKSVEMQEEAAPQEELVEGVGTEGVGAESVGAESLTQDLVLEEAQ